MKTREQIEEFVSQLPVGTIVEVPETFDRKGFLDLNGQRVHKDDYPRLAETFKDTIFDQGEHLLLVDPEYLHKMDEIKQGAGTKTNFKLGMIKGNKLVVKAV